MLTSNYLRSHVIISLLAVIILPSYVYFYIAPKFETFIVENKEREAVRIAGHIASRLLQGGKNIEEGTTADILVRNDRGLRDEFQIEKLKLFLPNGRIVFSSNADDIGVVNNKDYFFEKVAKGKIVTKVVRKDTLSLEGRVMMLDVVETYVPVMQGSKFMGAFELYLDITDARKYLRILMYQVYIVIIAISAALLLAVIAGAIKGSSTIKKQQELEKKLYEKSITDDLTGLLNRRGFFLMAEKQVQLSKRMGNKFAILYADMDNLKRINDTLGHKVGDQALVEMSSLLELIFRAADVIGRLGGDEFAILLSSSAEVDDESLITQRIEENLLEFNRKSGKSYDLSISVGIAKYDPDRGSSLDQLMAEADTLMYKEKQQRKKSGRNL